MYRILALAVLAGTALMAQAQKALTIATSSYIEPLRLEVSHNKTCNLIFPLAITSLDRGSQDILVKKADGVENILRIKAASKTFEETNLSVITSDGRLYSFLVCYHPNPVQLNVVVGLQERTSVKQASGERFSITESFSRQATAGKSAIPLKVIAAAPNIHSRARKARMQLALTGLYVEGQTFYFRLRLENTSAIHFPIESLRFYLRDKKEARRTPSQEVELAIQPLAGDTSLVHAQSGDTLVIALPAFTIPEGKYLKIEVREKSGGRHLALRLRNRQLLRAASLAIEPTANK